MNDDEGWTFSGDATVEAVFVFPGCTLTAAQMAAVSLVIANGDHQRMPETRFLSYEHFEAMARHVGIEIHAQGSGTLTDAQLDYIQTNYPAAYRSLAYNASPVAAQIVVRELVDAARKAAKEIKGYWFANFGMRRGHIRYAPHRFDQRRP